MDYPRVSRIISMFANFSHVREEILYEAQIRGTQVHEACLSYACGFCAIPLPPEHQGYFESFRGWFDKYVDKVLYAEGFFFNGNTNSGQYYETLRDETYGYRGRPDIVFRYKGSESNILGDLKTPRAQSRLWQLSLAAYEHLLEAYGIPIHGRVSLRLKEDGSGVLLPPSGNEYEDPRLAFMYFSQAVNLHRFLTNAA